MIFIPKRGPQSWKVLAQVPTEFSTIRFASRHRTLGTRSHRNLLQAHLECQNARSMPWVVKKASSLAKVGCGEHWATIVTLKSSFHAEESERRILKGYCRGIGPRSPLFMYVLGLRPKLRTRDCPRRGNRYYRNLC